MRIFLTILILIFNLQSWTKADQHDLSINKEKIKELEGSYCGYLIYESGHEFRIISTIKVNDQNNIWGNYIFENYDRDENKETFGDGEVYKGIFFKGKIENIIGESPPIFKVKVFWMDDFGDGYLNLSFMPGVSFKGNWGLEKNEGTWSGMKCNPETGETSKFK